MGVKLPASKMNVAVLVWLDSYYIGTFPNFWYFSSFQGNICLLCYFYGAVKPYQL